MRKLIPFLACSISVLLLTTGMAKVYSVLHPEPFMLANDPVFPFLKIRQLLCLTALIEITPAFYVGLRKYSMSAMVATSVFVALIGTYRFIFLSTFFSQCICMGSLLDWLRLPESVKHILPVLVLAYLGIASILALWINLRYIKSSS